MIIPCSKCERFIFIVIYLILMLFSERINEYFLMNIYKIFTFVGICAGKKIETARRRMHDSMFVYKIKIFYDVDFICS